MKLLVIRFSALGDVAMTVPVIDALARRYRDVDITILSRPHVQPLFARMPAHVHFRGIDLNRYKGIGGLYRLFRELKREGYDAVADLHDVLRSQVIRTLFACTGARVAHIDKGRSEKKALTRPHNKQLHPLPSSFDRYEAVFARLGYPVKSDFRSIYGDGQGDPSLFQTVTGLPDGTRWIGIAPFAAHPGKILPEETMQRLLTLLSAREDYRIFLFGGGKEETRQLEAWAASSPRITSVAGKLTLEAELSLMSHLHVMVSMDSANMHVASLVGIPVVSVWGATHPYTGFMGWKQSERHAVQVALPCRPCSIFGNKPCRRGDYACLTRIKAEDILRNIEEIINQP